MLFFSFQEKCESLCKQGEKVEEVLFHIFHKRTRGFILDNKNVPNRVKLSEGNFIAGGRVFKAPSKKGRLGGGASPPVGGIFEKK